MDIDVYDWIVNDSRQQPSVLAACASEWLSEGPTLWLCSSASQDELGMAVDVSDGNTEHGVRLNGGSQTATGEAETEMP